MSQTPPQISVNGVRFQISMLKPRPEADKLWIAVHPVSMRFSDQKIIGDTNIYTPADFSSPRGSAVAIAGGTDPEGGLNEQEATIARAVAYLVEQRFGENGVSPSLGAQRFAPGEENPNDFELDQSPVCYVAFRSAVDARQMETYLNFLAKEPQMVREAIDEMQGPRFIETVPGPRKNATKPSAESRIMDKLAAIVNDKAPHCPDKEKTALVAGLMEYITRELTTAKEEIAAKPKQRRSGR